DKILSLQKEVDAYQADGPDGVEAFRLKFISRKGVLGELFEELKKVAPEEKKNVGRILNQLKQSAEARFRELSEVGAPTAAKAEGIDLSLPPVPNKVGNLHPLTLTRMRIIQIFERLGFNVEHGPEIEDDWHNFTALNFPENHPAREMQDTFFVSRNPDILLRTHTSNVQIRMLEKTRPPLRAIMP